jgi:hypothetical protein
MPPPIVLFKGKRKKQITPSKINFLSTLEPLSNEDLGLCYDVDVQSSYRSSTNIGKVPLDKKLQEEEENLLSSRVYQEPLVSPMAEPDRTTIRTMSIKFIEAIVKAEKQLSIVE